MMIRIRTIPVLLALAFPCAAPLSAQSTADLRFGVTRGTLAAGSLNEFDQAARTGFTAGLAVTIPVAGWFGLRLGVAYSGRGTTYGINRSVILPGDVDDPNDVRGTLTYRRDYIEISGLARGVLFGGGRTSLYALAGPALAFSRTCSVEFWTPFVDSGRWGTTFSRCEIPVDRSTRIQLAETADFGAIAGIGADAEVWDMRFAVEALYYLGLTSANYGGGEAVRHRVTSVQFGFSLPLG